MSGTSLDGLDLAFCRFRKIKTGWAYSIDQAITVKYAASWANRLSSAHNLKGEDLIRLDADYGKWLGNTCRDFLDQHKLRPDFIASHGHTIFHQPGKGYTYQLGNGNALHAVAKVPVISDFRSLDVFLGGEGAPLVPAGDKILFSDYDVCLNLGGIANLSMDINKKRVAFDICFLNMALNYLAAEVNKKFDKGGALAEAGSLNTALWKKLATANAKFRTRRPSLGREVFESQIKPLLEDKAIPLSDRLRTFTESAAAEIAGAIISNKEKGKILCTGGGAFNSFFMSRLLELCGDHVDLIVPEDEVVKFKEALVFAFLGVLRSRGEKNSLKSVTRASRDSSGGVMMGF